MTAINSKTYLPELKSNHGIRSDCDLITANPLTRMIKTFEQHQSDAHGDYPPRYARGTLI